MTLSRIPSVRLWRRLVLASSAAGLAQGGALAQTAFHVEPHAASYEAIVVDVAPELGVAGGAGTLTSRIELTCAVATANQRLAARIDAAGSAPAMAELQARYEETTDGRALRFEKISAFNGELLRRETGGARRDPFERRIRVTYREPPGARAQGPLDALFPQAFRDRILEAARAGRTGFEAVVFDGTLGEAFLDATASIGAPLERGVGPRFADHASLRGLRAWPVQIRYETMSDQRGDEAPTGFDYAYHLYENGVLDRLNIDFGQFRIEARLTVLDYEERPRGCADER